MRSRKNKACAAYHHCKHHLIVFLMSYSLHLLSQARQKKSHMTKITGCNHLLTHMLYFNNAIDN